MIFRANECAKRSGTYCLWFHAVDEYMDAKMKPKSASKRAREKERFAPDERSEAGRHLGPVSLIRGSPHAHHGEDCRGHGDQNLEAHDVQSDWVDPARVGTSLVKTSWTRSVVHEV